MGTIRQQCYPGDDCSRCYPSGQTPLRRYIFFAGIRQTDHWIPGAGSPANAYYNMLQDDVNPCQWFNFYFRFGTCDVEYEAVNSRAHLSNPSRVDCFADLGPPTCRNYFTNQYLNAPGFMFWKGWAYSATWCALAAKVESVTPLLGPDPRLDVFPMANEEIVVKYVNKQDGTNIKIKFDVS